MPCLCTFMQDIAFPPCACRNVETTPWSMGILYSQSPRRPSLDVLAKIGMEHLNRPLLVALAESDRPIKWGPHIVKIRAHLVHLPEVVKDFAKSYSEPRFFLQQFHHFLALSFSPFLLPFGKQGEEPNRKHYRALFFPRQAEETYGAGRNRAGLSAADINAVLPLRRLEDRARVSVFLEPTDHRYAVHHCRRPTKLSAGALARVVSLVRK